jgi:mRNA interferase MazF
MRRGEIYYVEYSGDWTGNEVMGGRPAIVVSNDIVNLNSQLIVIVYLTTQDRATPYLRPKIESSGRTSFAICDQVTTISVKKIDKYCGICSKEEMDAVGEAISINLNLQNKNINDDLNQDEGTKRELMKISIERDLFKSMYDNLLKSLVTR